MNKIIFYSFLLIFSTFSLAAQDLSKNEVPSVIINNFQSTFPDANDIEWEKKGEQYKVEFEIGYWNEDRSAWYNKEGKLLRHIQEIAKKDLPDIVYKNINKDYKWYIITDAKRITEEQETTFQVELKSLTKEWEVLYDKSGKIVNKKRD